MNENIVTFLDLVPKVRKLGVEVFLEQMRIQRKRLVGTLAEAGGEFQMFWGNYKIMHWEKREIHDNSGLLKVCSFRFQEHYW